MKSDIMCGGGKGGTAVSSQSKVYMHTIKQARRRTHRLLVGQQVEADDAPQGVGRDADLACHGACTREERSGIRGRRTHPFRVGTSTHTCAYASSNRIRAPEERRWCLRNKATTHKNPYIHAHTCMHAHPRPYTCMYVYLYMHACMQLLLTREAPLVPAEEGHHAVHLRRHLVQNHLCVCRLFVGCSWGVRGVFVGYSWGIRGRECVTKEGHSHQQ